LDVLLLPIIAVVLIRLLLRAGNTRNLPLASILVLLSVTNAGFHLGVLGELDLPPMTALHAALGLIIMIECVMAGRVIPAFTMSVTPGLQLKSSPIRERLTLGLTAVGLLLWLISPFVTAACSVLLSACVFHLDRLWRWRPLLARHKPLLWVLHAAYLWIPMGLALLGLAQLGWVSVSAGIHALAVGATGGLIIGMITRTARGHTGRLLAVSRPEVVAYGLVMVTAIMRVLFPLLMPGLYSTLLWLSAATWCAAFLIYLWIYAPWLMRPRIDGKDG
jgi:uncharacterized protein involved in response to NO